MTAFDTHLRYSDFRRQVMTVEEIVSLYSRYESVNSDLQTRKISTEQRSRIIETLLIGMPQYPIFIDNTDSEWLVIDGIERVRAYVEFCHGKLKLSSLYFKKNQYEGKTFNELSMLARKNVLNTEIVVNVLNPGLTKQERFGVYACLRTRLDSDSLSACRKIIFTPNYQSVVSLAKNIYKELKITKRTASLENEICHLLVVAHSGGLETNSSYHLDVAANAVLERDDFESFLSQQREKIIRILKKSTDKGRYPVFVIKQKDYYNGVLLQREQTTSEEFSNAWKRLPMRDRLLPQNSVDFFLRHIKILIEYIEGQ